MCLNLLLRELLDAKDALRSRLNVEQEERQRLSMLEALATQPAKTKVGWWQRLLGGGE